MKDKGVVIFYRGYLNMSGIYHVPFEIVSIVKDGNKITTPTSGEYRLLDYKVAMTKYYRGSTSWCTAPFFKNINVDNKNLSVYKMIIYIGEKV